MRLATPELEEKEIGKKRAKKGQRRRRIRRAVVQAKDTEEKRLE
jgi:hypothetical protein